MMVAPFSMVMLYVGALVLVLLGGCINFSVPRIVAAVLSFARSMAVLSFFVFSPKQPGRQSRQTDSPPIASRLSNFFIRFFLFN